MNRKKIIFPLLIIILFLIFGLANHSFASYKIKDDKVYYNEKIVDGADFITFEILNYNYAKDKNNVYREGLLMGQADPSTFEVINGLFSKDKNMVYQGYNGKLPYIDPNTVEAIDENFFKDKNGIYIHGTKIQGVDIISFEVIGESYSKDKNNVYYHITSILGADVNTFKSLDYHFSKDAKNIYFHGNVFCDADYDSFLPLNSRYAKDKKNVFRLWSIRNDWYADKIIDADPSTFEVFKEDEFYAIDKNNMYYGGKILEEGGETITNSILYHQLKGKIILKVEENGEAYYVSPNKKAMHFLSRPLIAFYIMREQGIGITNENLEKIPVADNYCPNYSPNCDKPQKYNKFFTDNQKGKIFLQVENNGEAWYVNPEDGKRYFLGRPADAFQVMRNLGLGISNSDFEKL